MRTWMRVSVVLCVLLVLLTVPAMAYEVPTDFTDLSLEQAMDEFMQAYGLDATNFSVSYHNTGTGERYTFNDKTFMVAGSTYKLQLNMYYYELEHAGTMAPDVYISRVGATLDVAHEQSLVYSNNEMSIGMLYNLGEFRSYKELMRKYFTMPEEEIEPIYYKDNYYCTHMMMDALSYLYEYRADFEEMIGYMKQAQPGEYFKKYVTEYEVAHKYGWFEGAVNDVGIIYTPQPFLLAVYSTFVGTAPVEQAARLFTNYTLWSAPKEVEKPTHLELEVQYVPLPEDAPAEVPAEVPEEVPQEDVQEVFAEEPAEAQSAFEWWMVAVALGVFLLGGGAVLFLLKKSRPKR